jgi:protein gp37
MSATSSIEWTDRTWNPVRGCSVISPGCTNCYAMKQAHRFSGEGRAYFGLTKQTKAGPQWTGQVRCVDSALEEPLRWRTPSRIFVNSMSDLFHENVPDSFIAAVFAVMGAASRHTFQVLTKRPEGMRRWFETMRSDVAGRLFDAAVAAGVDSTTFDNGFPGWPLPNVWLGVSVESQKYADERIPLLLQTPAAVRFISAEPLLGPVDLRRFIGGEDADGYCVRCGCAFEEGVTHDECPPGFGPRLDWVIVGGESGPSARPCALEWIESIVAQCRRAAVPVFVKQLGAFVVSEHRTMDEDTRSVFRQDIQAACLKAPNGEYWAWRAGLRDKKGGDLSEFPAELRIREFPEARA